MAFLSRKSGARREQIRKERPDTVLRRWEKLRENGVLVSLQIAAVFWILTTAVLMCDYTGVQVRTAEFQNYPLSPVLLPLRQAFGLACYSISPSGARKLRNFCTPIRAMSIPCRGAKGGNVPNIGIDLMMSAAFRHMKAFVSMTPLVISTNEWNRSTVRGLQTQTVP